MCVTSHDSTGEGLWVLKITKMYVQYLFAIVVCYTKRRCSCSERWPQLKVEIEDGRVVSYSLVAYIHYYNVYGTTLEMSKIV